MNLYTIVMSLIPIRLTTGGTIAHITTNVTALLTSAIASCALPIITYIASPAFRRSQSQKQRHSG